MDQQNNVVVITREPSRDMTKCELTHIQDRIPIDFDTVKQQHKEYVTMFEECGGGVQVVRLPTLERYPDAVFVEDPFLLTNECAIITRPIASRQQEYEGELLAAVKQVRPFVHQILEPGHCEGGDMFVAYEEHKASAAAGRKFLFIGKSTRSNDAAFEDLKGILGAYSYQVIQIPISKCLHLKSAVTLVAPMTVLLNPEWVDAAVFARLGFRVLTIDPSEPDAGNVLYFKYVTTTSSSGEEEEKQTKQQTVVVNHRVVVQKGFPKTAAKIRAELSSKEQEIYYSPPESDPGAAATVTHRWEVVELQYDELAKAEGALTCCSLIAYC